MKKINILAVILVFSSAFSAFGSAPVLNNRMDSLNYALGVANGNNVKMFYLSNDTTGTAVESLLKGLNEALNNKSDYYELEVLASNIGDAMKKQNENGFMGIEGRTVNFDVFKQGLINGFRAYDSQMAPQEANMYLQVESQKAREIELEKLYGENRIAGESFLAENATKEGVVTLASGLQYKIVKEGKGEVPTAASQVKVHYHGTLIDGTVFDSSVERNEPASFGVTQVIKGWTEALQLMPVGSKWVLYVPQNLAYGSQSPSDVISPFSALIFEVELLGIEK